MRHELNDEPALSEAGAARLAFQLHHLGLIVGEEGSAAWQSNRVEEPHDGPHFRHVCPAPARMTEREPADHGPLVGSTRGMACDDGP